MSENENDFTRDEYEEALASVGAGGPYVSWNDYLYMKEKYEKLYEEHEKLKATIKAWEAK